MTLAGFIAYAGALAIAAAIPGPGVTALVARALGSGFRSSLIMALGLSRVPKSMSPRRRIGANIVLAFWKRVRF
jgi:hypothetical protein